MAVTARLSAADRALVGSVLSPAELRLFGRMPRYDQRHCLDVYATLVRAGYDDSLLLRAALLHDCGKVGDDGRPIPLLYYGIFVILLRFAPALYDLAVRSGRGPLRHFAIHAAHEQRSAMLVEQAGGSVEVASILRDYAARCTTKQTASLYWADELN